MSTCKPWQLLKECPFDLFVRPIQINDDEFILIPYSYSNTKTTNKNGIYKYNTLTNLWILWIEDKEKYLESSTYDIKSNKKELYATTPYHDLITVN